MMGVKLLHNLTIFTFIVSLPAIFATLGYLALFVFQLDAPIGLRIESMYLLLFLVGIPLELVAIGTTFYCLVKRQLTTLALQFMAAGHLLCLAGLIAQTVMLVNAADGWELLFLPFAFSPGQLVAGIGLLLAIRRSPGAGPSSS